MNNLNIRSVPPFLIFSLLLGSKARLFLNAILGFMSRCLLEIGNFYVGNTTWIYVKAFLKARSEPPCIMLSLVLGSMSRCLQYLDLCQGVY